MALFKTDSARAGYPSCVLLHGSFIVPASPAYNLQIVPVSLALGAQGVSAAQVSCTVNPTGLKVPIFCNPYAGQPIPATNTSRLPAALPSGGVSPIGSEYLLDLGGFPADIVSAEVDICRQSRNAVNNDVQFSIIDTVNKLLFIQTVLFTSGGASAPAGGSLISFQVALKDSIGI